VGIKTYSAFVYGHTITDSNKYIDFNEGAGELTAVIAIGSYTLSDFATAASSAINAIGTQEYTVSINRATRKLTISAASNFDVLAATGSNNSQTTYTLMGFISDSLSATSHVGANASGSYYEPQNILQKFVDFTNNVKTISATSRQTASGKVEVVSYGTVNYMECNIVPITDITPQLSIKDNASAVADFRTFMNYCITKAPIEFIEDVATPTVFDECLLESTRESKIGVDFKIKELFNRKLFGYYESGALTFRGL